MRLINKDHAVVVKAASDDETRYIIQSVLIEETEKGIRTVATDGRMLAMVEDDNTLDVKEFPENVIPAGAPNGATSAIVPVQAIKDAVKGLPKKTTLPVLQNVLIVLGKDQTTLGTTDLETPKVITAKNIEGTYPNYNQVIPKSDKKNLSIGFAPELMLRAFQIAKDFGLWGIKMEFSGPLCPVKMTGEKGGKRLTIVVMPVRL